MESILKKIIDQIYIDEKENFSLYDKTGKVYGKHLVAMDGKGAGTISERELPLRDIYSALDKGFTLIAEVKKGSPSKGVIQPDFDPIAIAQGYEAGGAGAISVLTEKNFFLGNKIYLTNVKKNTTIPVIRKDFIVHLSQIDEAYLIGADFILLIASVLDENKLREFSHRAAQLGLGVLLEVHDEQELDKALRVSPRMIGINNRNLSTFHVDLQTSFRLKKLIPSTIYTISESGINSHNEIQKLIENGFSGALVGESIVREGNYKDAVRTLLGVSNK